MILHPLHTSEPLPEQFTYPFCYTPHPMALKAKEEVMNHIHTYLSTHPYSELHQHGKMFGVLVCTQATEHDSPTEALRHYELSPAGAPGLHYLAAFSAMLDGTYNHDGFVPPVYELDGNDWIGQNKADSQLKQQAIFRQYRFLNATGAYRALPDLFAAQRPILSPDEYFNRRHNRATSSPSTSANSPTESLSLPAGAGECCAPKLLQYAYLHHLTPVCMAEFWIGPSPKDELRIEGNCYPACTSRCKPILSHMLQGLNVAPNPLLEQGKQLALQTTILYEDNDLLVVNKPAGLLSTPGKDEAYSLEEYLQDIRPNFPFVRLAHRLDMATSGIIVAAKNSETYILLQKLFLRRDIHKKYLAILEPRLTCATDEKEGLISLPLLPNPLDRPRQMVNHQHGKPAITRWQRLDSITLANGQTIDCSDCRNGIAVALYPETGRTHQLRVHCAHPDGLGSPIQGDNLYGYTSANKEGAPAVQQQLMLHATELIFPHPTTGEQLHITCPPNWSVSLS